jgi:O-antigen/teichoic acid export membrane protein
MKLISKLWQILRQDKLLQRVIRNSSYLLSSNGVTIGLGMIQSILAARLLGVFSLGILGIVAEFSSNINRLFSSRMSEMVVKYLGDYLPQEKKQEAAAIVKVAALIEAASSILAFLLLLALSPLAARYLVKDPQTTPFFWFFGFSILGNLVAETSNGFLQATDRFSQQATINLMQSVITAGIITAAFLLNGSFLMVLTGYLVGKLILGIGPAVLAWRGLRETLGSGWWRVSLSVLPPWRELLRFIASTNLTTTVNLVCRDSEQLWIAYFLTPQFVGYYKIALAITRWLPIPITPFISTTYPEIARIIAAREWKKVRTLLRRVTFISGVYTALAAVGLVLFGRWVILLYGSEFLPAYPALLVLLVGYGFSNIMFWNRPLLLSFNLPAYPFFATFASGVIKVILAFMVIPTFGFVGAASLLSGYFLLSGGLMVVRGFKELARSEQIYPVGGTA